MIHTKRVRRLSRTPKLIWRQCNTNSTKSFQQGGAAAPSAVPLVRPTRSKLNQKYLRSDVEESEETFLMRWASTDIDLCTGAAILPCLLVALAFPSSRSSIFRHTCSSSTAA